MSFNLETRVERLERLKPANPYEQMTDEELQARLDYLNERLSEELGFNTKDMEIAEIQSLIRAEERGQENLKTVTEQLRGKYGPPLPRVGS